MQNGIALKHHWEKVYSKTLSGKPGWYTPHLQASLCWVNELDMPFYAPIIDVGCGISTFAEDLLDAGYRSLTVLDISGRALATVKTRLGRKKSLVTWLEGDIASVDLPQHYYELWHDRAVFHYFTTEEQQQTYREKLLNTLKPGGHLILGTFADGAPPKCSGLPVKRYTETELESLFGEEFVLLRHRRQRHVTPGGKGQMYLFCHFQRHE